MAVRVWMLIAIVYFGAHINGIYSLYQYEANATIITATTEFTSGKPNTVYTVINKSNNDEISRIDSREGWPGNLERRDRISKNKSSFDYCINNECSMKPLYTELNSMFFPVGMLLIVLLLTLIIGVFDTTARIIYKKVQKSD